MGGGIYGLLEMGSAMSLAVMSLCCRTHPGWTNSNDKRVEDVPLCGSAPCRPNVATGCPMLTVCWYPRHADIPPQSREEVLGAELEQVKAQLASVQAEQREQEVLGQLAAERQVALMEEMQQAAERAVEQYADFIRLRLEEWDFTPEQAGQFLGGAPQPQVLPGDARAVCQRAREQWEQLEQRVQQLEQRCRELEASLGERTPTRAHAVEGAAPVS